MRLTLSVNFDGQFEHVEDGLLSISDSLCIAAPSLQKKNRRRGVCGGGGDCAQAMPVSDR